jgi:hypothetical protein
VQWNYCRCCYKIWRKISQSESTKYSFFGYMVKFHRLRWDVGRPRSVRNVRIEEQILEVVERYPVISTTRLAARTSTSILLLTVHCKNSSCIPITFSLCIISATRCICIKRILSMDFAAVLQRPYIQIESLIH